MTMEMSRRWLSVLLLIVVATSTPSCSVVAFSHFSSLSQRRRRQQQQQQHPRTTYTSDVTLSSTVKSEDGTLSEAAAVPSWGPPDMAAYAAAYKTVFDEVKCAAQSPSSSSDVVLPADLPPGTYFRSGPAMFSAGSILPPKTSILKPKQPPVPDGQDPDRMVRHPYEGDGAILAVTLGAPSTSMTDDDAEDPGVAEAEDAPVTNDDNIVTRFRYVQTIASTKERKWGMKKYQAMESTRNTGGGALAGLANDWLTPLLRHHLQPGRNALRKNTANTRSIYWGQRLLALWEGGLPYKVDAMALSTEGPSQLGGAIKREEDSLNSKMVAATNAGDTTPSRALFYGIEHNPASPRSSELTLYEFNENFRLVEPKGRQTFDLPGFGVFNDFAATQDFAIFLQPAVTVSGMKYLVNKEPGKVLGLDASAAAQLHIVPRAGCNRPLATVTLPAPTKADGPDANWHFVNAYQEDNLLHVDVIRPKAASSSSSSIADWPWVDTLNKYRSAASRRSLWRYTIDWQKQTFVEKSCWSQADCAFGTVAPSVSTQKHQFLYMAVGRLGSDAAPPQGLAKLDCTTSEMTVWMPEPYEFCGEPVFVPRIGSTGEDDGYILSVLWNGKKAESELVVVDARNVADGPVTRIPLGVAVPHGLFGCYAIDATWPVDSLERRAKLAEKMESRGDTWNVVKSDFSGLGLRLDDIDEYFPGLFG